MHLPVMLWAGVSCLVCRCVVHDNAVAVGKAGVEAQRFAAEMLLKAGDKLSGFLGGDFVRAVILHYFLLRGRPRKGDKVCAQGDIVLLHFMPSDAASSGSAR